MDEKTFQPNVKETRFISSNMDSNLSCLTKQSKLNDLKKVLGCALSDSPNASVDAFLICYLSAANFSVDDAVKLLKQRRSFEVGLSCLCVTNAVLDTLRSGAVSVIGQDVFDRPILYIGIQRFPSLFIDTEEMQRIVTMLMEYMLSYCVHSFSLLPNEAASNSMLSSEKENKEQTLPRRHEITILVNEKSSPWHANQSILANMDVICRIISNYYPQLVGLILLFEASWEVRSGVTKMFEKKYSEAKGLVRMVTRENIQEYIDRRVLLRELGGTNTAERSPKVFADSVLRHWYLKTSYMSLVEMRSRPLWQLPPSFLCVSDWDILQHRKTHSFSTTGFCTPQSSSSAALCSLGKLLSSAASASHDDDGICSVFSENDELFNSSCGVTHELNELDVGANNGLNSSNLVVELQKERRLRVLAEQQLKKLRLGVALDLTVATEIERVLAFMHSELDILIGSVIIKAKNAVANGSPPTLLQLFNLTLSALELATHKVEMIPAMRLAEPVGESDVQSRYCCCM